MASPHLARYGTAEQKDRLMPKIVSGEIITAVAVTEPDGGSERLEDANSTPVPHSES